MRQNVSETLEVSRLELLYRVSTYDDLQDWATFQQSLEEAFLSWFHEHPGKKTACRLQSERHFVALVFERFRQAAVQGRVTCEALSGILVYLHASLNEAILDTLRVSERPGAVSSSWSDGESPSNRVDLWDTLHARLSNQHEQRLAYLLYHYGAISRRFIVCGALSRSES